MNKAEIEKILNSPVEPRDTRADSYKQARMDFGLAPEPDGWDGNMRTFWNDIDDSDLSAAAQKRRWQYSDAIRQELDADREAEEKAGRDAGYVRQDLWDHVCDFHGIERSDYRKLPEDKKEEMRATAKKWKRACYAIKGDRFKEKHVRSMSFYDWMEIVNYDTAPVKEKEKPAWATQ